MEPDKRKRRRHSRMNEEVGYIPKLSNDLPTVEGKYPQCDGCPYPRHGFACGDSESCLRKDVRQIEERSKAKR